METKNSYYVALIGLAISLLATIVSGSVAYGSLSNQVKVNKETISELRIAMKDLPTKAEISAIQSDVSAIKQLLMGNKK
jgi:hypothetical protein